MHYPLPLKYVEHPSPQVLQRTVDRLRKVLKQQAGDKENNNNTESLLLENQKLSQVYQQLRMASEHEIKKLQMENKRYRLITKVNC